jgi:hypothetical protein
MKLMRFALVAGLFLTAASWASEPGLSENGLVPRKALAKKPTQALSVSDWATGRVVVKFMDNEKFRPLANGKVGAKAGYGRAAALESVEDARSEFGVRFVSMFEQPQQKLDQLEARANARGFEAPDFGGMMYVEGFRNDADMLDFMKRMNNLDSVEYVYDERPATRFDAPLKTLTTRVRPWSDLYSGPVKAPAESEQPTISFGPLVEATNDALGLTESVVTDLALPAHAANGFFVDLPIDGISVAATLRPHSVVSDDIQMLEAMPDGSYVPIAVPDLGTLRGELDDDPGSVVVGALLEDGLLAMIQRSDGSRYWVEPIATKVAGAQFGQHAVYSSDATTCSGTCAADMAQANQPAGFDRNHIGPVQGFEEVGAGFGGCHAELGLDLDFPWIEQAGSLDQAGLIAAAIVDIVNIQYEAEVNIKHVITTIIVRTTEASDPYTTNNPFDLLTQFRNEWNTNLSSVRRDVAHLLTGRELEGSVIGVAWIFGVCNVAGDGERLSYGLSQRFGAMGCQTDLVAHELGHNWGAFHCDCVPPASEDEFTMNPFITCANAFSDGTIASIGAYRDFLSAICLNCAGEPAGCDTGAFDCETVHGTPYCDDAVCCGTVCTIEPFCCETAWDQMCVDLAEEFCTGCGEPDAGDCLAGNGSPGCSDGDCCATVIALDPACESFWDEECAMLAYLNCTFDTTADTPDLTAFQAYRTLESTPGFDTLTNAITGETFTGEGFDLNGVDQIGLDLLNLGIGEFSGARGAGIKIAVIEDSAYLDDGFDDNNPGHEDLTHVISEPGQRLFLDEELSSPSHGTAVLGIIAAEDNGFGMTGIASECEPYFFPTFSLNFGGRLTSAITAAMLELGPGDVMNFSIGFPGARGNDCTAGLEYLTSSAAVYTLVESATNLGITSVMSAGNECCNLDTTSEAGDDSGGIIVSACDPGVPFCRRDFSNHSATCPTTIPHVSAWGDFVATCGGSGDLWFSADPNRQYTTTFNGTSSAAPMVAAAVARIQGIAKQLYGIALSPLQIRGSRSGFQQCLLPECSEDQLGNDDDNGDACDGDDWPQEPANPGDPTGQPNYIGEFPEIRSWVGSAINGNWFDGSNLLENIYIIVGDHVYGNHFSVRSNDGNYLIIGSQHVSQGDAPSGNGGGAIPEASRIQYIADGAITDIIAEFYAEIDDVNSLGMSYTIRYPGAFTLVWVEMYDYDFQRWDFVDVVWMPGPPPEGANWAFNSQPPKPAPYVRDDGRILVRFWTFGFTENIGFGTANYRARWDLIDLDVSSEFGEQLP